MKVFSQQTGMYFKVEGRKHVTLGSPVKFTLYPDADHDSWTKTYANPELWEWLKEQHR